jgi:Flp pilus assembly protein TadG
VFRDRRGAVSVVAALALPVLIGFSALVGEYGRGLLVKSENQRVADLAAYAGALAYNATGSTTSMTSAADSVAALNGVAAASVTATLVNSPTGSGSQAVQVRVQTSVPLYLSQVLSSRTSLTVGATSYAELSAQAGGCIIALSGAGSGVSLSGGTSVTTSGCSVASNASLAVPCGTTLTTKAVSYNTTAPVVGCGGIQPPAGTGSVSISKKALTDPLAANAGVTGAYSHLSGITNLSGPAGPSVSGGTAVAFAYSPATTQAQLVADGCSGSFASPVWTVTCPNGGSYTFGAISLGGGITVNFNTGGSASTTYSFSGLIDNSGTALNFGPGTYNIAKGVQNHGGASTTFGAGAFNIGRAASNGICPAQYSICNPAGATMTFGGPSSFSLQGGIYNGGGAHMTLGSGTTNSYWIGPSSDGNAFLLGGSAQLFMGDATGGGSNTFQVVGDLNGSGAGGSCTTIAAAPQHDFRGSISLAGGMNLGAGVYSVSGYVAFGPSGGGDVTCGGVATGVMGDGVTLVIGGSTTPASGTCTGLAFCIGAGYGHVTLVAPSSGATQDLAVLGPSGNSAGALFTAGASNTSISGAMYFPNGAISMSGGANLGGGAGQCLEVVGTQVSLSGGSTMATSCPSLATASSSKVTLVQ